VSPHNVIVKYADDTTLLVGQHSSVDISQEYENICSWSFRNSSLSILTKQKIVFHRPASAISVFSLLCQTLNELLRLLYLELTYSLHFSIRKIGCLCKLINVYTYGRSSSRNAWTFRRYIHYLLVLSCPRSHTHYQLSQSNSRL